jgi:hypothetical protein
LARRIAVIRKEKPMKGHRYRITIEPLDGATDTAVPFSFEAVSHDELFGIVERVRASSRWDADTAAQLAVGLKLFGEVLLQERKSELFTPLTGGSFKEFMQGFKAAMQAEPDGASR